MKKEENFLTKVVGLIAFSLLLQSCIMPDRWREEVFVFEAMLSEEYSLDHDSRLVMFITSSGFEYDLHSPYSVSIRFDSGEVDAESVVINGLNARIEGQEVHDMSLRNLHSRSPVEFGSKTVDINPAPCCLFWIASSRFELIHKQGQTLKVRLDYCLVESGKSECLIEERRFRAIVRKGNFTMAGV